MTEMAVSVSLWEINIGKIFPIMGTEAKSCSNIVLSKRATKTTNYQIHEIPLHTFSVNSPDATLGVASGTLGKVSQGEKSSEI